MLKNEVYNCDNLVLMKTTPDKYYDLGIIDPPYGINAPKMAMGTSKTRSKTGNGISTAQRLKGKLNTGSGKLKNRILNKSSIDWDNQTPSNEFCPVCNGTGELIKANFIKIEQSFFNAKYILKIMNAAILLDHEEIQLILLNTENAVFKIKDVYVKIVCMNKDIINNNVDVGELLLTIK